MKRNYHEDRLSIVFMGGNWTFNRRNNNTQENISTCTLSYTGGDVFFHPLVMMSCKEVDMWQYAGRYMMIEYLTTWLLVAWPMSATSISLQANPQDYFDEKRHLS